MDAVIVTGAAGALGHAVVEEFLAGGRAVVALDRPSERLDALGERENVHAIGVDLAAREAVQDAFTQVDALPVTPNALVGLAGGFTPGKLADTTEDVVDQPLHVQLRLRALDGAGRGHALRAGRRRS